MFLLKDTAGTLKLLALAARGRITLAAFWSRYCLPSLEDLPALERMAARLQRAGVRVVTINTDERISEDLQRFLTAKRLTFPVYADTRGATRAARSVSGARRPTIW